MAARLRKTFQYPSEDADNDNSDREELDEEEQETLIEHLAKRDLDNTIFYRRAFTALPAVAALVYLPILFSAESFRHVLLALLSWTVLGATVYILLCVPSAPVAVDSSRLSAAMIDGRGPLDIALPWLNAVLTAVLALSGVLAWKKDLGDEAWRAFLPGGPSHIRIYIPSFANLSCVAIFLVTMYARSQLVPLDVASLERLKYNYKGA